MRMPNYVGALFDFLVSNLEEMFPAFRSKRAISASVAAIIIVALIIAGGLTLLYFLVFAPGPASTTITAHS